MPIIANDCALSRFGGHLSFRGRTGVNGSLVETPPHIVLRVVSVLEPLRRFDDYWFLSVFHTVFSGLASNHLASGPHIFGPHRQIMHWSCSSSPDTGSRFSNTGSI